MENMPDDILATARKIVVKLKLPAGTWERTDAWEAIAQALLDERNRSSSLTCPKEDER